MLEEYKFKRILWSSIRGYDRKPEIWKPIIMPTTKADVGHDEDISREEILSQGLVSESDYVLLEKYITVISRGTEMAKQRGLILVDTKYEFGKDSQGNITLIDEIHTPDSSRYFILKDMRKKLSISKTAI